MHCACNACSWGWPTEATNSQYNKAANNTKQIKQKIKILIEQTKQ